MIFFKHSCSHLQEHSEVDDNLRCCDSQVDDSVVNGFAGLERTETLLEVCIKRPQFETLVQSPLNGLPLVMVINTDSRACRGPLEEL